MKEKTRLMNELAEKVLDQLKNQNYMESSLTNYRRLYRRLHIFLVQHGTETYSKGLGKEFLKSHNVSHSTYTAYSCAIRRLDDCLEGKPYRCHHDNPQEKVPDAFKEILESYLEHCKRSGNKPATLKAKEQTCILFLKYIESIGCIDISRIDASLVSKALLIFENKDNYARIRQFLKYLADNGVTGIDISGIVPRYKRRKPLPTTYTPSEIGRAEDTIDTNTDTGKRNIAIIRLATRMGLRSGDIAGLKRSEIDFESGYIHINQKKTGEPLSLRMPDDVSAALRQHLENVNLKPNADGYVFHSMSAPYGRITTSIIRHIVNHCFDEAGIDIVDKKHGPHTFRSSLASSMVNDGVSYETVRKILGHSDPDAIKRYAKTDVENLRLCAIKPPIPTGAFLDYLSGKKAVSHV